MRKTSLQRALLLAGAVALAGVGVAQAETFNTPTQAGEASTMTYGQPNMLTDNNGPVMNSDWTLTHPSTTVLGAGPVVEYDYSYTTPSTTILGAGPLPPPVVDYSYSMPSTTVLGAGPTTITTYTYSTPLVCGVWGQHDGASETSNVPQRAGEASTMTNGAPNLLSNNSSC